MLILPNQRDKIVTRARKNTLRACGFSCFLRYFTQREVLYLPDAGAVLKAQVRLELLFNML